MTPPIYGRSSTITWVRIEARGARLHRKQLGVSNPGKQTTSLVNGLFYADALGNLLKTEFNAMLWWDLRNGQEGGNNNSASLYGWRRYGDYGIVNSTDPAGPADRYPTFYVDKLLKYFARGGEKVVQAKSDYLSLGVYAVKGNDQSLRILVINKHPSAALNATLSIPGLKKGEKAKFSVTGSRRMKRRAPERARPMYSNPH